MVFGCSSGDKDEWKIMVGNMKNDVGIWMFIKNQVVCKAIRTLHLVMLCIHKEIPDNKLGGQYKTLQ